MARDAILSDDSGLHRANPAAPAQSRRGAAPPEKDRREDDRAPEDQSDELDEETGEEESAEEEAPAYRRSFLNSGFFRSFGSVVFSMTFHLVVLLALALTVLETPVKQQLQTIVANLREEPPPEFVEVELDQQIEAATEQAVSVMRSAAVSGAIGSGTGTVGGGVSGDPTLQVDSQVAERANVAEIAIAGIDALAPATERIIEEVPEGFLGDARAVVDDYQEAMDRITQEILINLQKSPVLVVWCFDQSESMKDDQQEIRGKIYRVYEELGLVNATNNDALATAVTSYGEGFLVHTRAPTADVNEIKLAIEQVPLDPSGKEMMCSAVRESINLHRNYCIKTHRRMLLVLVTDESGDRPDNDQSLESTIAVAKAAQCKVYTLGRESVFGYPYAFMSWVHPQTGQVHWLRIDRGPETAFVEQLQTNGFHRRHDAFPSGFGPYEQARLSRETGGIFFMLPSLESNLVRGEKRRYELDIMRPYRTDLRSRAECFFDRGKSHLRTTLWDIIYTFDPYNPQAAQYIELRVEFSREFPSFLKEVDHELKKLPLYLSALAAASETVEKLQKTREQETDPRWQANYDLLRAHLVAYQARVYEYGSYLRAFAQKPDEYPFTKLPNLTLVDLNLGTRAETITTESKPYIERSLELYNTVIVNHPGTPWAALAQQEINRGFGVRLYPDYEPPLKSFTGKPIPVPNF